MEFSQGAEEVSLVEKLERLYSEQVEAATEAQVQQAERYWQDVLIPKLFDTARHGRKRFYFRWEGFGPAPHYFEYDDPKKLSPFEERIISLAKENKLIVSVIQAPNGGRCLSIGF